MSRKCELSSIGPMSGNNVSHANNRTRRRFLPNLRSVKLYSEALSESFSFKVAAATLRTVEHRGGLDSHLMSEKSGNLSQLAQTVRGRIVEAKTSNTSA